MKLKVKKRKDILTLQSTFMNPFAPDFPAPDVSEL